jgi:hypothetical protein
VFAASIIRAMKNMSHTTQRNNPEDSHPQLPKFENNVSLLYSTFAGPFLLSAISLTAFDRSAVVRH